MTVKTIQQLNKALAGAPVRSYTRLHVVWKVPRNTNSRWPPFPSQKRTLSPSSPSEKHSFWNILVFSSPKPTNQERIRQKTTTASRFGEGVCGERNEGAVLHFEEDLLLGNVCRAGGRDWRWVWETWRDVKRTPCVFAERRNINNTGKAKRDGSQNKNDVTMFLGFEYNFYRSFSLYII